MFSASPLTMSAEPVSRISTSPRTLVSGPGTNSLGTGTSLASPSAMVALANAGRLVPTAATKLRVSAVNPRVSDLFMVSTSPLLDKGLSAATTLAQPSCKVNAATVSGCTRKHSLGLPGWHVSRVGWRPSHKRTAANEAPPSERRTLLDTTALREQMLASATDAVNALCTWAYDQLLANFDAREEHVLNV